ncbi:basic-leucine zipper transcription factor [Phycomyces blakesleeanus NRRL 1555(-)]|uniref:Basic-leucine zipper transcription factor n=2 Tax=Phycomyces blakesleeanus TaxID=4837 RepID=A0A167Q1D8_PHYB8|nr:basic-leucine zipper transcription factor [Phycomyces blakesleeanus NRRL 1555(-)]OAD78899.1 basic-leucine zipper transcription factor [Phycomyces blakesleeanus NRRL 1555(-)]|eukprot:XP_018296939.1 basic-leucine zipper transcription factor [Phycomyces blakesleeanus NRRL 1555(-)]
MSLSSIMTGPIYSPLSPSRPTRIISNKNHQISPRQSFSIALQSPPTTPEERRIASTSPPSSPHSFSSGLSSVSLSLVPHRSSISSISTDLSSVAPILTLQERRLRNKTASAKYRQKKNQQQNEMRQMIGCLSEQNAVLERQLQELRTENERLKAITDRLRGKIVAKKMLKQWMGRQKELPQNHSRHALNTTFVRSHQQKQALRETQNLHTILINSSASSSPPPPPPHGSQNISFRHSDDEELLSLVDSDQCEGELDSLVSD